MGDLRTNDVLDPGRHLDRDCFPDHVPRRFGRRFNMDWWIVVLIVALAACCLIPMLLMRRNHGSNKDVAKDRQSRPSTEHVERR